MGAAAGRAGDSGGDVWGLGVVITEAALGRCGARHTAGPGGVEARGGSGSTWVAAAARRVHAKGGAAS